jgi:hypothetical protein
MAVPFLVAEVNLDTTGAEGEVEGLELRNALANSLAHCPHCRSTSFTDRKVTKKNPASPDASRAQLPPQAQPSYR